MENYTTCISVVDNNNKIIYIKIDDIFKSPILTRILGLSDEFNDDPKKDDKGNYLYFNSLSGKSILFIFKCIGKTNDEILKDMSIVNFIYTMGNENFYKACLFADYHCIDLSYELINNVKKLPINQKEDIYNEFQFLKFLLDDYSIDKDLHHRILTAKYLDKGWHIVKQDVVKYNPYNENNDEHVPKLYELTLRKYINDS